jgi:hypothetical protein
LGGALKALTESFGDLFKAFTEDGDETTTSMEEMATALEKIAKAINAIADAYTKAKNAINFLNGPKGKFDGFFGLPGLPNPFSYNPQGKAAGGSVMSNQPYRVGEFGPETFYPAGTSGSIRPDGSGSGVTIVMNGVIDGESARRSIERLLQDSSRRTGAINLVGATL